MVEISLRERFARTCRCPREFAEMDLDGMDDGGDDRYAFALRKVREVGDRLAALELERDAGRVSLLIDGPWGTGKTRCACWLLWRAYEGMRTRSSSSTGYGRAPLFLRASRLAELRFKSSADRAADEVEEEDRLRERLDHARLLAIDDLGRVAGYRGEEQFIQGVIEDRWEAGRSTIITASSLEAVSGRFADFLRYFTRLTFVGDSHRGEA